MFITREEKVIYALIMQQAKGVGWLRLLGRRIFFSGWRSLRWRMFMVSVTRDRSSWDYILHVMCVGRWPQQVPSPATSTPFSLPFFFEACIRNQKEIVLSLYLHSVSLILLMKRRETIPTIFYLKKERSGSTNKW